MKYYLYSKPNRSIEPVRDKELNAKAKTKLQEIYKKRKEFEIPKKYIKNWDSVALYNPQGKLGKGLSILIDPQEGAYSLENRLNDLTGKEWVKFSCSWFIFNALPKDLKQEKELDPKTEEHPATFSPTMIEQFVNFFTKEGGKVLDPFCGIGSTLEACKRTGRTGYGIELNKKYHQLCLKRTPEFKNNIFNEDASNIKKLKLPMMDFCISSPPYWDILNRSTHTFKKDRLKKEFDYNYSSKSEDLGNIDDYDLFLKKLCDIYFGVYNILREGAYLVVIIKNVKKGGKIYPLAWDMARILSEKYVLKDEKIWIQDKVGLAPYGYPFSWTSNILHHYCIILRKEK